MTEDDITAAESAELRTISTPDAEKVALAPSTEPLGTKTPSEARTPGTPDAEKLLGDEKSEGKTPDMEKVFSSKEELNAKTPEGEGEGVVRSVDEVDIKVDPQTPN